MATDRVRAHRVAWGLISVLSACRPVVRPDQPPAEPAPVVRLDKPKPIATSGRQVLIGELCPTIAAGRPAIAPLVMRTTSWSDTASDLANAIERGSAPRFGVFGVDGKIAGVFDTLGLTDLSPSQQAATGTYVGGLPCTRDAGGGQRAEEPTCAPVTGGCGLAAAELSRPDDLPPMPDYRTGAACLVGDALAVDIDSDGAMEQFPLAGVLDGVRSPATEWTALSNAQPPAKCAPKFTLYDVRLSPVVEPGKPIDPKHAVGLDLLGVVDLDGDARMELVLALRFPTVRTIVVYTAPGVSQRLELAGEAQSFPR